MKKGIPTLYTSQLILQTADRLHLPEDIVAAMLQTLEDVITEAVLKQHRVVLRNFGTFRIKSRQGNNKVPALRFKPAQELKKLIREKLGGPMDKLGVALENEAVLLAKVTGLCPVCKIALCQTDPPQCTNCGTKPFEKKEQIDATREETG